MAKDFPSKKIQKTSLFIYHKYWKNETNFQRFYLLKIAKNKFIYYIINKKIEIKKEKNNYKIF